jgi:hypothetical protein
MHGTRPQALRRELDGLEDLQVTRAATEVSGEGIGDLRP